MIDLDRFVYQRKKECCRMLVCPGFHSWNSSEMMAVDNLDSNIDRYFYAFMAFLFAATAIAGFTPNSLAILAGTKDSHR